MKTIFKILFILSLYIPNCLAAEKITLEYEAYTGGFNGLNIVTEIKITDDSYYMKSQAKTQWFIGLVYPLVSYFTSVGKIINDKLIVNNYEIVKKVRSNERKKIMLFDEAGNPLEKIYVKNDNETITDLTEFQEIAKDTLDYQSMLLALYYQTKLNDNCNTSLAIFNGKEKKTLIFKDNGYAVLPPDKQYTIFSGQTRECHITIDKESLQDEDIAWLFRNEGEQEQKPIKVFLSDKYMTPFPIMVMAEIGAMDYGKIYLYLTKVSIE